MFLSEENGQLADRVLGGVLREYQIDQIGCGGEHVSSAERVATPRLFQMRMQDPADLFDGPRMTMSTVPGGHNGL